MEKVEKDKNFAELPLGDICDPFSYNYYQQLTNFDVLKVAIAIHIMYIYNLRIKLKQFAYSCIYFAA